MKISFDNIVRNAGFGLAIVVGLFVLGFCFPNRYSFLLGSFILVSVVEYIVLKISILYFEQVSIWPISLKNRTAKFMMLLVLGSVFAVLLFLQIKCVTKAFH